jgi:hypothetical protein
VGRRSKRTSACLSIGENPYQVRSMDLPFHEALVGIELGRASCRWGVTVLALSIARRVHIPTMTTFTEAPLQSRKVEFLDSGFRLGFPREAFPRQAKLKRSLAFTPTHSGLPLDSSLKDMAPPAFAVDHSRTAKCSELLCRARALLAPGWCPAPPRRALPLLLRSYELMRQTSSLRRTSCFHTYSQRSWQVAASPCWKLVLPDVTLQVFPRMLEP